MFIDTNTDGTDGRVSLLGAFGPTIETQNITNQADLSLTKDVNDTTPDVGQDIVYTLVVANAGTAGATNVEVEDVLPAGTDFVSFTPTQGTYDDTTSIWTVGDLAVDGTATLMITATVLTPGAKVNLAEITRLGSARSRLDARQQRPGEDDQDDVTVDADADRPVADQEVNDDTPNRNQDVTFTITVTNAGPDQATGVVVEDLLPAGVDVRLVEPQPGQLCQRHGRVDRRHDQQRRQRHAGDRRHRDRRSGPRRTRRRSSPPTRTTSIRRPTTATDEDDLDSVTITPTVADISVTKTVNDATPDRNQNDHVHDHRDQRRTRASDRRRRSPTCCRPV